MVPARQPAWLKKPASSAPAPRPADLVKTVSPPIQKGSTVLLPHAAALYDDDALCHLRPRRPGRPRGAEARRWASWKAPRASASIRPGLAAITGAMLAVLKAGDEVLVADNIYKPTRRFCDNVLKRFGVAARYFDPAALARGHGRLATPDTPG